MNGSSEVLLSSWCQCFRVLEVIVAFFTRISCVFFNVSTAYKCFKRRETILWGEGSDKDSDMVGVIVDNRYKERGIVLGDIVEQVIAESADKVVATLRTKVRSHRGLHDHLWAPVSFVLFWLQ